MHCAHKIILKKNKNAKTFGPKRANWTVVLNVHSRIAEFVLSMHACENTFQLKVFFPVVFVANFDDGGSGYHIKHCGFPIQMQCVFYGGFEQNQN